MFVTEAFAQAPSSPGFDSIFGMVLPLILIMGVFWFLLIRPQQQRVKAHQELLKNVRRGDTIVTSGGVIGKVSKVVDDHEILVEVAENVRMRFQKSAIAEVRTKGEPVKEDAAKK
jgi:preprotein translocase subunit YajC